MVAGEPSTGLSVSPSTQVAVAGRSAHLVWENELGGLTFEVGDDPERCFLKWLPATSGIDLSDEVARLTWAVAYSPVPRVLSRGADRTGSWLLTAALPGESAVSDRWRADPDRAVRGIGAGLRALHEALPVGACPFSWSVADRLDDARHRAAAGRLQPARWHEVHQPLGVRGALDVLADAPPVDRLVVCHGDACAPNTLLARDLGVGVLILVDELQEATSEELAALNTAVHHLGQADIPLPLTFVGAGLPSLPAQLAEATSYAERLYDYRPVGLLSELASKDALVVPALERGVDWAREGLASAIATARGYPYFLQFIGKHVWDNARMSPIDLRDVQVGLADARREVDDGLYRSRWERATPAQRELLRALAGMGGEGAATVADIAKAMAKSRTSDISVARNELIKKGLVYAPERGLLAFTVPGIHDFIDRQP